MLTLTPSAKAAIERLLDEPRVPDGAGVRIAPKDPGSNGLVGRDLRLSVAKEPAANDEVLDEEGTRVFLDGTVTEFLADKQLDAEVVDERVGFIIAEQP